MCMDVLPSCMCVYHVHASTPPPRGQERALDPLELELQMLVSHYASAGNET